MKIFENCSLFVLAVLLLGVSVHAQQIDHSIWDETVRRHVNQSHLVDYAGLKADAIPGLDAYLSMLAAPWPEGLSPDEVKAAKINAYNALTVRWIVRHYPLESIWKTPDPFRARRHTVNGQVFSLDELESSLRAGGDPRVHAALVCAARSCPPLRAEAYRAADLESQLDDNARQWLANPSLNEFFPGDRVAAVSPILQWYADDFRDSGGVARFLARHAPPDARRFLETAGPDWAPAYKSYHWGLNDASGLGQDYEHLEQGIDRAASGDLFNKAKDWFLGLGESYGVNPVVFGAIYVGAIPFFSLSIGWLVRNLRQRKSPVAPLLAASFCFVSAYLYLMIAGKNIPLWVYVFLAAMVVFGIVSTVRKVRSQLGRKETHEV